MKLFQQLLVAPAALGLLSPVVVQASELNLDGVNRYATEEQVTSIEQFSDVKPTDWAYQALSNLIERYGCVAGYPNGTYKGGQAMTRYEAAALLNACLDRITEVTDELKRLMAEFEKELAVLRGRVDGLEAKVGELEANQFSTTTKLNGKATFVIGANSYSGDARPGGYNSRAEFLRDSERAADLIGVDELVDDEVRLEAIARIFRNNAGQGNTRTLTDRQQELVDRLSGGYTGSRQFKDAPGVVKDVLRADFISAVTGTPIGTEFSDWASRRQGATVFNYDVKLNFDTSFTGKDLFRTQLRAGNFRDSAFGGPIVGLNALEAGFEEDCGTNTDCGDVVAINRLFYQFPIGSNFTATIGGRVRQDDMLAMWPSAYPADTVLDFFTYAGAPGTYSLNLGAGGGLWWQSGNFSVSVNYVSANADNGDTALGGIGTSNSSQTGTAQIGYAGNNWGIAAAYTYGNGAGGLYSGNGTPFAVDASLLASSSNSVGVSAYWQPSTAGWIPSISGGWGITGYNSDSAGFNYDGVKSQSWYVGLQWQDVFIKGNAFGMAVGQPTFITSFGDNDTVKNFLGDSPNDGNYAWEWWYKFQVTDNISVTPALFYLSAPLGQYQKVGSDDTFNNFGGLVKTTFKF